jgi:hypothetical protein
MDQLTDERPKKGKGGGDQRSVAAKVATASREEQIVALRLRKVSFSAIGRTVGVSKLTAIKTFYRALRRNTDHDIQTHHRNELADLEMEQARIWTTMDRTPANAKVQIAGVRALNLIHVRRARLLGLDAPTQMDIRGLYRTGADEMTAERAARRRVLQELPVEEQVRLYRIFEEAERRAGAIPTTATVVTKESDARNSVEPPARGAGESEDIQDQ